MISGHHNETIPISISTLNLSNVGNELRNDGVMRSLTPKLANLARIASSNMAVIPLYNAPAFNSSFNLQFYGPSLQCSFANSIQQKSFEFYRKSIIVGNLDDGTRPTNRANVRGFLGEPVATSPTYKTTNWLSPIAPIQPQMLVSSIFQPWNNESMKVTLGPEIFAENRLAPSEKTCKSDPSIPECVSGKYGFYIPQLWIQTANESLVCTLVNSSFDTLFEFVDGTQTMAQYTIKESQPVIFPWGLYPTDLDDRRDLLPDIQAYVDVFNSISLLLMGNVTSSIYSYGESSIKAQRIIKQSSGILQTGLGACDEIIDGYWNSNPVGIARHDYTFEFVHWKSAFTMETGPSSIQKWTYDSSRIPENLTSLFTRAEKPQWMCRNRTLLRAIEDLMNNITLSLLSDPSYTYSIQLRTNSHLED